MIHNVEYGYYYFIFSSNFFFYFTGASKQKSLWNQYVYINACVYMCENGRPYEEEKLDNIKHQAS